MDEANQHSIDKYYKYSNVCCKHINQNPQTFIPPASSIAVCRRIDLFEGVIK